jgi:hypothetical protein
MSSEEEKELLKELRDYITIQSESSEKKQKREFWDNLSAKFNVIAGAFYMLTTIFIFTYITEDSRWRGEIDNILKTDSTIASLRLKREIRNQLGSHVSIPAYFEMEKARGEIVANLFVDFGKIIGLRPEDMEYFRRKAERELGRSLKTGTTRGGNR